jgi:hypothetical protein
MENFKDIVDMAKNMINFTDEDPQIDLIIKGAINHFYRFDMAKISKNITRGIMIPVNGLAKLPEDCLQPIEFDPPLNSSDKMYENSDVIKTSLTGSINIIYSAVREPLVADDDVPEVAQKYWYPMALYGCMRYYTHRKKWNEVAAYRNILDEELKAIEDFKEIPGKMKSTYSGFMGGDLY